jgi:hypothetical protein
MLNGSRSDEVLSIPVDSDQANNTALASQLEKERLARKGIVSGMPTTSAAARRSYSEYQSDYEEDQPQAKCNLPSS